MGSDRRTRKRSAKAVRRRADGKPVRRTAGRPPRKGVRTAATALHTPGRSVEAKQRSTLRGPVLPGRPAGSLLANDRETVVYGLVSYEDLEREEREEVRQLLTGDLTHLQRRIEDRAPGRPWIAVALGLACAAIAELRGSPP